MTLNSLVITDIDTVNSNGHHERTIPKKNKGVISSNQTIINWMSNKKSYDELIEIPEEEKIISKEDFSIKLAYQIPFDVNINEKLEEALPRTFEDAFVYANINEIKGIQTESKGLLQVVATNLNSSDICMDTLQDVLFNNLKSSNGKTEFALDVLFEMEPDKIIIPNYIRNGLDWLEKTLENNEN